MNRCELAEHHMRCEAIAAALRDEDELLQAVGKSKPYTFILHNRLLIILRVTSGAKHLNCESAALS